MYNRVVNRHDRGQNHVHRELDMIGDRIVVNRHDRVNRIMYNRVVNRHDRGQNHVQ